MAQVKNNPSNAQKSNEMGIEKIWPVIESFFRRNEYKFASSQIESYNDFLNQIPDILDEFNGEHIEEEGGEGLTINFGNYTLVTPRETIKSSTFDSDEKITRLLYPYECSQRNIPYCSSLYVDISIVPGGTYRNVLLMQFPIMTGSDLCNLAKVFKDPKKVASLGEDLNDTFGYFLSTPIKKDGHHGKPVQKRVIVPQERIVYNIPIFTTPKENKRDTKEYYASKLEIRCSLGVAGMTVTHLGITQDKAVRMVLPWISGNFPILIVLRAMGYDHEFFRRTALVDAERDIPFFERCIEDSWGVNTQEDALKYISKRRKYNPGETEEQRINYVKYTLLHTLFIHLNAKYTNRGVEEDEEIIYRRKAHYLMYLYRLKLAHCTGEIPDTTRDHFGYKRVQSAGAICAQHFYNTFKRFIGDIKRTVSEHLSPDNKGKVDIRSFFDNEKLTKSWQKAFSNNGWNVTLSKVDGVCQIQDSLNQIAKIASINKVYNGIGGKEGKNVKVIAPRDYHPSQAMKIDPYDTPEGGKVGLLKSLAMTTHMTSQKEIYPIVKYLYSLKDPEDDEKYVTPFDECPDPFNYVPVLCNGTWVGCSLYAKKLIEQIRVARRHLILDWDITVYLDEMGSVHIMCDQGRLIRPVFTVEGGKLRYNDKIRRKLESGEYSFKDLVSKGIVEYIGDLEEDSPETYICARFEELCEDHSHCELHSSVMAGFATAGIPFFNRNPAARNCYEDSMMKQAASFSATNWRQSYENGLMVLDYPQRPLATTRYTKLFEYDQTPGETCAMALICSSVFNEEDSIELNQSSVERGFAVARILKVYTTEYMYDSFLGIPTPDMIDLGPMDPSQLEEDGIIAKGCIVKKNTILIGLLNKNPKWCDDGSRPNFGRKPYISECVLYDSDLPGIVDSVQISDSPNGGRTIRVAVLQKRLPMVGDKFSAKHGQKGTVGMLRRQEDMPFNRHGMTPDIIVSPAAIPSRMTLGMLVEMLAGLAVTTSSILHSVNAQKFIKALEAKRDSEGQREWFKRYILEGGLIDATAFNEEITVEELMKELRSKGFNCTGDDQFYDGATGEPLYGLSYYGPVSYHRLKHLSYEKAHARSYGRITPLFRQPVEGRKSDGGFRFGTMENDCAVSNNNAYFIQDTNYNRSDPFAIRVCNRCGLMQDRLGRCSMCEEYNVD